MEEKRIVYKGYDIFPVIRYVVETRDDDYTFENVEDAKEFIDDEITWLKE